MHAHAQHALTNGHTTHTVRACMQLFVASSRGRLGQDQPAVIKIIAY
uniref:Uncharacterized protein n=1 Tax=Aegilops tauschii subsp. strangulata TaxID=200361 RepID=A0A453L8A6_AEGTS